MRELAVCPGCRLERPSQGIPGDERFNASGECRALHDEVSYYTLAHGRERFIHQHLVDAYAAQHVRDDGPAISAAFSLAGLYLATEKDFSGRQVQQMHIRMARLSRQWPRFNAPPDPGPLTIADVHAAPAGIERDQVLLAWCATVWAAWGPDQQRVRELVERFL